MKKQTGPAWTSVLAVTILATCFMSPRTFAGTITGEELYKSKCASCHGLDGAGDTVMGKKFKAHDFRSTDVQKQSDDELNQITTKGKGKMPAFGGKLKKEQIGELVGYIRTFGKEK